MSFQACNQKALQAMQEQHLESRRARQEILRQHEELIQKVRRSAKKMEEKSPDFSIEEWVALQEQKVLNLTVLRLKASTTPSEVNIFLHEMQLVDRLVFDGEEKVQKIKNFTSNIDKN